MKLHKIALLASLSILPMQQSFAVNANHMGLAQPANSKATLVMPTQKIQKLKQVTPRQTETGTIAGSGGTAAGRLQNTAVVGSNLIAKMGKNLKLLSFKWDDEICAQGCPQLRNYGINYATCDLAFRVTNTGDEAISSFNVNMLRTTYLGDVVPVQINDGRFKLAPHETKTFKISADTLGLYKVGRPFTLTLDHLNQIAETNENDNTTTFLAPS